MFVIKCIYASSMKLVALPKAWNQCFQISLNFKFSLVLLYWLYFVYHVYPFKKAILSKREFLDIYLISSSYPLFFNLVLTQLVIGWAKTHRNYVTSQWDANPHMHTDYSERKRDLEKNLPVFNIRFWQCIPIGIYWGPASFKYIFTSQSVLENVIERKVLPSIFSHMW